MIHPPHPPPSFLPPPIRANSRNSRIDPFLVSSPQPLHLRGLLSPCPMPRRILEGGAGHVAGPDQLVLALLPLEEQDGDDPGAVGTELDPPGDPPEVRR